MAAPVLGSARVAMTKDATTPRLKPRRLHTGGSAADFLTCCRLMCSRTVSTISPNEPSPDADGMGDRCLEGSLCASRKTSARWPKFGCFAGWMTSALRSRVPSTPTRRCSKQRPAPACCHAHPDRADRYSTQARGRTASARCSLGGCPPPRCSGKAVVQLRWPPWSARRQPQTAPDQQVHDRWLEY
jgi:hypothetical protein